MLGHDGSISGCDSTGNGYGRVETEDLVADCGEIGEGLEGAGEVDAKI